MEVCPHLPENCSLCAGSIGASATSDGDGTHENDMLAAVKANSVRRLSMQGQGWSDATLKKLIYTAVEHNSLDVICYLVERAPGFRHAPTLPRLWPRPNVGPHGRDRQLIELAPLACQLAAHKGHRDLLEWLRAHGCPWDSAVMAVCARNGDLELLKWLYSCGCPCTANVHKAAIHAGHMHVLVYLHEQGSPVYALVSLIDTAAEHGRLDCLKFLHERGYPWHDETYTHACVGTSRFCRRRYPDVGHPEVVRYLHEHGCPWSERSFSWAYPTKRMAELMDHRRTSLSQIECARYMLAHGCPCPAEERALWVRLVARRLLLPRWRLIVRVRPYALHWLEEHEQAQCAPEGEGRKRDRDSFEADSLCSVNKPV